MISYSARFQMHTTSYVCFEGTFNWLQIFKRPPPKGHGVCIWPECLLHLAPLFRLCKQCWQVRNTVIFYIKNGYCHAPIGWRLDQWTVQTPSLGVRDAHCTILGAVGCFYPDIHDDWVGGLASAMVQTPWTVPSGFLPHTIS